MVVDDKPELALQKCPCYRSSAHSELYTITAGLGGMSIILYTSLGDNEALKS